MDTNESCKKLKVGVVGLGKMGIMHACLLNTMPNVTLTALCDKSRIMRTLGKRVFCESLVTDKLIRLADLNLDAIYVLTPIPSHYPIIKEILAMNMAENLFVEKTLTSSFTQSEEIVKLKQNHQGICMVGYMKRFGVTFNKAKSLLDEQVLGDLISFDAYAFSSDFADLPEGSVVSAARGGALEDLGSHVVDSALWFFGDLSVTSAKVNSEAEKKSAGSVIFEVKGLKSLRGSFEVSWCKKGYRMPEFGLVVKGTDGKLTVNDDEVKLEINGNTPEVWYRQNLKDNVGFFLGGQEYYRENIHFINSILSGTIPKSDFNSAVKVDYLLDQVRRAVNA